MDWIDIALIALGVGVCGLLHLIAFALARSQATAGQEQAEQRSTGSLKEVKR